MNSFDLEKALNGEPITHKELGGKIYVVGYSRSKTYIEQCLIIQHEDDLEDTFEAISIDTLSSQFEMWKEMIKENNGWIKTKDRLPELNGFSFSVRCLLWGQEKENDHEEMIFLGSLFKNGEWYSFNGKCFNVIYWQPLPEPPREKNEN